MANTKVTQHVIANNAIQEAMITDAAVTPDKLHGTLDLSSKSLTLPSAAVATTQSASDNSTKLATTAYVTTAVSNLVDSAPSSLDTLNELAAALNDDASFSTTVTNSIATKLPLAGGTMTGNIAHASDFTIDVGGDISLDADGGEILLKDGGTEVGRFLLDDNNHLKLKSIQSNADILFQGNDGGSGITALRFDMSSAGFATFNDGGSFGGTGALKVPVGTTAQRPSAATGQIRWNSTDGALEVYNGSSWTAVGTSGSNKVLDTFTGDGSTTAFTLSVTPANEDALMVFIDGVYQEKGDYSLSNAIITLDTAPASGEKIAVHTTTASVHDGTSALTQQFTGDGSTTAFTLSQDPGGENNTQVFVNGVYQAKTTYSVSGTTLTFASAPANSAVIEVVMFTVATLGNTDTVTEGVSNLYHTSARAISAVSAGNLTGLIVDTNVLKVDASSNRVGIGTASPGSLLTVEGDIRQTTGDLLYQGGGNWDIKHLADDQNILFYTSQSGSATEKMRIKANGNVGIGETNPDAPLHINSNTPIIAYDETDTGQEFRLGVFGGAFALYDSNDTAFRMLVDGSGNLGIGTSSPDSTLHIKGGADSYLTLEAGSTDGNTAILMQNSGGTQEAYILYDTDDNRMLFGANSAERMRIDSFGRVGIGTTSPSGNLHVASTGDGLVLSRSGYDTYSLQHSAGVGMAIYNVTDSKSAMLFDGSSRVLINRTSSASTNGRLDVFRDSGEHCINCEVAGTSNSTLVGFFNANGFVGGINTSGSATSYNTSSDYRLKENVNYEFDALSRVKQLKPARFNFIVDKDKTVDGFLAHEVSDIVPEAITGEKDGEEMQGIDHSKLVPLLTKAIQELEARVKELEG